MSSSLSQYIEKRNFEKTSEPYPVKTKSNSKKLKFVIQRHQARALHYDLRLELNGVLKSWAVPKGVSLSSEERRLAVQTEDHPIEYLEFEGEIPKGEYGAGQMKIWDEGVWRPVGKPNESLERGKLSFELKGQRLQGTWTLVRTSKSRKNWLLIKNEGELQPEEASKASPWPPMKVQLATLVDKAPRSGEWLEEVKFDGYRILIKRDDKEIRICSRNSNDWTEKLKIFSEDILKLPVRNCLLDGELVWAGAESATQFQKLQNAIKEGNDSNLRVYVFDILYLDGHDLRSSSLRERKEILKSLLAGQSGRILYSEHFEEKAERFYEEACRAQLEGIMLKRANSSYQQGRSKTWLKLKCEKRQEFVVGGYTDPAGSRKHFGALLLGFFENGKLRYCGKVGTGFNSLSLKEIRSQLEPLEQVSTPFQSASPRKTKAIHWVFPELVAEIGFSQWTQDLKLRHPRFLGIREDKSAEKVVREKSQSLNKITKKDSESAAVLGVKLTSLQKLLYEEPRLTKLDLAHYYEGIAPFMLDFIENRPLSLVRCPEGDPEDCFFQKHPSEAITKYLPNKDIREKKAKRNYVFVKSPKDLVWLVQYSSLELHVWGAKVDKPERPDLIVFDLDPGEGVKFRNLVEAAFQMRDFLKELKLESFVRTTGGKGLHIVVPIERRNTWEEVKNFSKNVSKAFESFDSKRFIAKSTLAARKNKIYIDYLRNAMGATSIALFSTRAKKGATVAMPLDWGDLHSQLDPKGFNINSALGICKAWKAHPWARLLEIRQRLSADALRLKF